ncbi:hypothetical protein ES708_23378 [subsurface metagenome]
MEVSKQLRFRELIEKLTNSGGRLCALSLDDTRELERLLRERVSEEELGCPALGEE